MPAFPATRGISSRSRPSNPFGFPREVPECFDVREKPRRAAWRHPTLLPRFRKCKASSSSRSGTCGNQPLFAVP